jgi:hypothetical protein
MVIYENNSENQLFKEDEDVIATKLSKQHRLDDNHKFLISLIFV